MPRIPLHVEWDDLSALRKVVCICSLLLFFGLGTPAFYLENNIYDSGAKEANSSTQQVYPVHVMHGSLRFVTREKEYQLIFWRGWMAGFVGFPAMIGFFTMFGPELLAGLRRERARKKAT